jgi:CBS domain-containing protein
LRSTLLGAADAKLRRRESAKPRGRNRLPTAGADSIGAGIDSRERPFDGSELSPAGFVQSLEHVVVLDLQRLLFGVFFERLLLPAEAGFDVLDASEQLSPSLRQEFAHFGFFGHGQILLTTKPVVNRKPSELESDLMKVEDLMTTDVGACRPFDSVDRSAKVMWERDCGAVPVVDQEGRAIAMLTDRDICMAALTQGKSLGEIHVSSAMSRRLWSCRPDDDLKQAEETMRTHQVRRLPVIDHDGKLVGVLSISDLARAAASAKGGRSKKKPVGASEVGETLKAISTPSVGN